MLPFPSLAWACMPHVNTKRVRFVWLDDRRPRAFDSSGAHRGLEKASIGVYADTWIEYNFFETTRNNGVDREWDLPFGSGIS
jgi:hypothetical protein